MEAAREYCGLKAVPNTRPWGTSSPAWIIEVNRRKQRTIGAVRQLVALRRRYRADPLRPSRIGELSHAAGTIEDVVILKRHVPNGNIVLSDQRQIAVRSSDGKETDETQVDLRGRKPMQVTVIPICSLRHVPGDIVGVGVGHPWRNVEQHVVGIPLRTDMKSVGVEIERRRRHLLRIDRDRLPPACTAD